MNINVWLLIRQLRSAIAVNIVRRIQISKSIEESCVPSVEFAQYFQKDISYFSRIHITLTLAVTSALTSPPRSATPMTRVFLMSCPATRKPRHPRRRRACSDKPGESAVPARYHGVVPLRK